MKIGIGCDTKGYRLKLHLIEVLKSNGHEVDDAGCYSLDKVDYPDYASLVGQGVSSGKYERGVLICGTGQGMAMAANKIKGVRAALCYDTLPAILSREHNNANVFCTGSWIMTPEKAAEVLLHWLDMGYTGGGHQEKLDKMAVLEESFGKFDGQFPGR
jgi:ribose 5-phosphate isomerase B